MEVSWRESLLSSVRPWEPSDDFGGEWRRWHATCPGHWEINAADVVSILKSVYQYDLTRILDWVGLKVAYTHTYVCVHIRIVIQWNFVCLVLINVDMSRVICDWELPLKIQPSDVISDDHPIGGCRIPLIHFNVTLTERKKTQQQSIEQSQQIVTYHDVLHHLIFLLISPWYCHQIQIPKLIPSKSPRSPKQMVGFFPHLWWTKKGLGSDWIPSASAMRLPLNWQSMREWLAWRAGLWEIWKFTHQDKSFTLWFNNTNLGFTLQ